MIYVSVPRDTLGQEKRSTEVAVYKGQGYSISPLPYDCFCRP